MAKSKPRSELPAAVRLPVYLPNEVLEMILDYIGDDKPALASCALASQRFYHLAAPRLYARLEWGNNSKFPLTLPTYDVNTPLHRRFQTKLDVILSHTREFHLDDHCKPHCKWCPWTKALVKRIPENLSIPILSYNAFSNGRYVNSEENHIITPSSRCELLAQFAPVKLVIRASYSEPLPIRSINQQNLAKIVSWVSIDDEYPGCDREQQIIPFAKSEANTKTVVYIIHDMSTLDKQLSVAAGSPLARIKEHLAEVIYRREYAQEICVVNALGSAHDDVFRTYQAQIMSTLNEEGKKVEAYWKTKRGRGAAKYKTVSAAEGTSIKFLDIREYLTKHDTAGEFTDGDKAKYMGRDGSDNEN